MPWTALVLAWFWASSTASAELNNGTFGQELGLAGVLVTIFSGLWLLVLSIVATLTLGASRNRDRVKRAALYGVGCGFALFLLFGFPFSSPLSAVDQAFGSLPWLLGPSATVTFLMAVRLRRQER